MTKTEIKLRLDMYRECERKIVAGAQEYRVEDKTFKRADLSIVRQIIKELESELKAKDPSRKRMRSQRVILHRN